MPNQPWSDALSGSERREALATVDRGLVGAVADSRRSSPHEFDPPSRIERGEDWYLREFIAGMFAPEVERQIRIGLASLAPEDRLALLRRVGQGERITELLAEAQGGLSREQRERWSRERRTVKL
jgi:hypothetical protein